MKLPSPDTSIPYPKSIAAVFSVFVFALGAVEISGEQSEQIVLQPQEVQAASLTLVRTPETKISTSKNTIIETHAITFETRYEYDNSLEVGNQYVSQEGVNGERSQTYAVEYFWGDEASKTLIEETQTDPIAEVIVVGTKPSTLETPEGTFEYSQKMNVYATSYDGNCAGCSGITATGTSVYHGICAVDPRVIPLGTTFYVPGYGNCLAADTGGSIKGNIIDLGFESVQSGWWSSRWTDIYIQ